MSRRGSLCSRRVKSLRASPAAASFLSGDWPLASAQSRLWPDGFVPTVGTLGGWTRTTLYERLMGIERPWRVCDMRLALKQGAVEVGVEFVGETLSAGLAARRARGTTRIGGLGSTPARQGMS